MKKLINEVLKLFGIMAIVTIAWQLIEVLLIGEIRPNKVDSIVGTILTISLYENLKTWNKSNL